MGVFFYETYWEQIYGPDYNREVNKTHHRWLHGQTWASEVRGDEVKRVLDCERDVRVVSRQSVVSTREIAPGETITREMLTIKRPGTGILAYRLDEVLGRVAERAIEIDVPIVEEDLA